MSARLSSDSKSNKETSQCQRTKKRKKQKQNQELVWCQRKSSMAEHEMEATIENNKKKKQKENCLNTMYTLGGHNGGKKGMVASIERIKRRKVARREGTTHIYSTRYSSSKWAVPSLLEARGDVESQRE